MAVLELRTIDLDYRAHVSQEAFRSSFHHARFAGTGRPQKEKITNRSAGAGHAREKRLVDVYDLIDRFILADKTFA